MTFLTFHVNDIRTRTQLISTADSPSSATVRWKSASDTGSWFFWWNLSAGNIMEGTFRVDVKPGRVFFTDLDKVYPMVATPRGLALIINNETFACPSFYTQRYVILYIYIYQIYNVSSQIRISSGHSLPWEPLPAAWLQRHRGSESHTKWDPHQDYRVFRLYRT